MPHDAIYDILYDGYMWCCDMQFVIPHSKAGTVPIVNPSHVCWAHSLLQTFPTDHPLPTSSAQTTTSHTAATSKPSNKNTIFYLEEWNYLLHNEIEPALHATTKLLKKAGVEEEEWAILYKPLASVMFRCYTGILQVSILWYYSTLLVFVISIFLAAVNGSSIIIGGTAATANAIAIASGNGSACLSIC